MAPNAMKKLQGKTAPWRSAAIRKTELVIENRSLPEDGISLNIWTTRMLKRKWSEEKIPKGLVPFRTPSEIKMRTQN